MLLECYFEAESPINFSRLAANPVAFGAASGISCLALAFVAFRACAPSQGSIFGGVCFASLSIPIFKCCRTRRHITLRSVCYFMM